MKRLLIILIAMACIAATSCKKNNDHPATGTEEPDTDGPGTEPADGDAVVTEIGRPTGEMAQKTIGPSGGTLTSVDGTAELTIPAGALEKEQTITLQPVESKLPQRLQKNAYRIGPDNLSFKKEADLVMKYTGKKAHDAPSDMIHLAEQESNGKWKMAGNVTRNKAGRTISGKILRTKVISLFEEYELIDNKLNSDTAVVPLLVGEKVQFRVFRIGWFKDSVMSVPYPMFVEKDIKEWAVNGVVSPPVEHPYGHFTEESLKERMNYIAPIKAPKLDTVAVSVQLKLNSRGIFLLVRNVVIIDPNRVNLNGKWYNVKGAAIILGGTLYISLTDLTNPAKTMGVNIAMIGVTGPGTYSFSDLTSVVAQDGGTPQKDWQSWYVDQDGKNVHAGGMVTITAGGFTVGRPLEGRVEGELLHKVNDKIERCSISGSFGVILGG